MHSSRSERRPRRLASATRPRQRRAPIWGRATAPPRRCSLDATGAKRAWRRGRDSNPRYRFRYTRFPVACLQPLGHLSGSHARRRRPELTALARDVLKSGKARHSTQPLRTQKRRDGQAVRPRVAPAGRVRFALNWTVSRDRSRYSAAPSRRGGREAEGTGLLNLHRGNPIEGSNPSLSAKSREARWGFEARRAPG